MEERMPVGVQVAPPFVILNTAPGEADHEA
jgi:hypothetical protein